MPQPYLPLTQAILAPKARYCRPASLTQKVTMESPAMAVMTDLERVMAITIGPLNSVEMANQRMIDAGVRLLLVMALAGMSSKLGLPNLSTTQRTILTRSLSLVHQNLRRNQKD